MRAPGEQDRETGGKPARPSGRRSRADRTYLPDQSNTRLRAVPGDLPTGQKLIVSELLTLLLGIDAMVFAAYESDAEDGGRIDLLSLRQGLRLAGLGDAVLAVASHSGDEAELLRTIFREEHAPKTLPMFDASVPQRADGRTIQAVIGCLSASSGDLADCEGVLSRRVGPRDAEAARTLLADELDIAVSVAGAAGLAALLTFLHEERGRPIRERRLPRQLTAVVVARQD